MRKLYVFAAAAMLTACGGGGNEGGLTADENAELNNAAAMLDSETLPPLDEPVNVGETAALPGTDEAATNGQ